MTFVRALRLGSIAAVVVACRGDDGAVRVAPPTGDRTADQASVRAALDSVAAGGTVQFAAGTYRIGGPGMEVATSGVSLVGHADGTILQGCLPDEMAGMDVDAFFERCNGVALTGGRQVVRGLTFEHFAASLGITGVQDSVESTPAWNTEGGHLIQGNTFRNSITIQVESNADSAIVFRGNTFRNTYHAVAMIGRNIHVLDNDVAAPEPGNVPFGWPSLAVGLRPQPGLPCSGNRIEGNTIEGHTDAVIIGVLPPDGPGATCTGNTVRNNDIRMRPVVHSKDAGPLAGTPAIGVAIRLMNMQTPFASGTMPLRMPAPPGGWPAEFANAAVQDNVIEGNRIEGAKGIAIELFYASGNRVTRNQIATVTPVTDAERATLMSAATFGIGAGRWLVSDGWSQVNGTMIWTSPGSEGNTVADNGTGSAR